MEEFIRFSEENLWTEIWPELTLAMGAVLILLVDAVVDGVHFFRPIKGKDGNTVFDLKGRFTHGISPYSNSRSSHQG